MGWDGMGWDGMNGKARRGLTFRPPASAATRSLTEASWLMRACALAGSMRISSSAGGSLMALRWTFQVVCSGGGDARSVGGVNELVRKTGE